MTDSHASLLTSSLECFQAVTVEGTRLILSVDDALSLGKGSEIGDTYAGTTVCLFAESLLLNGTFACESAIISVNTLAPVNHAGLSTSGGRDVDVPGVNNDQNMPGKRGVDGRPGQQLAVYLEDTPDGMPAVALAAAGGDGGPGQRSLKTRGGDGGDGAAGGSVILLAGLVPLKLAGRLRGVVRLPTLEQQKQAIGNLLAMSWPDLTGLPGWNEALAGLKAATAATTRDDVVRLLTTAGVHLEGATTACRAAATAAIDVSGGAYGTYGPGAPPGHDGKKGPQGSKAVVVFGSPEELAGSDFPSFFLVHPSQCARLLEAIRLRYLVLDPVNDPQAVTDLSGLLSRLHDRTELFAGLRDGSPLARYYAERERRFGTVDAVAQLRHIHVQCTALLAQLHSGQDSYGYEPHTVPLGSFQFYKDTLDRMIGNFDDIERNYHAYFEKLVRNAASMDQIRNAREQNTATVAEARERLRLVQATIPGMAFIIAGYESVLPDLRARLDVKIAEFTDRLHAKFDFEFDHLVSALTTLAFAPESKFMMLMQAGGFLYQGTSTLADESGVEVKRDYLIREAKTVGGDIDALLEGYRSLDNGTYQPEDPGAGKLIAEETQFRNTFQRFKNSMGNELREVEEALTAYIEKIQERNNQILRYNAAIILAARDASTIKATEERSAALDERALATMDPGLPDLVSFVSRLYYASRDHIMRTLNLTARAYRFWALSDRNLIAEAYGDKGVSDIGHAALVHASNTILNAYGQAVEKFGTGSTPFPAKPRDQGLLLEIPDYQVEMFRECRNITVSPVLARAETDLEESLFARMSNVRVSRVRAWIKGARTRSNQLRVRITHTGPETIVGTNGSEFEFDHEPVVKNFMYDLASGRIFQDADFGIEPIRDPGSQTYAPVGPFATWQIEVEPSANPGVDLSGVTGVTLEFHGSSYAFHVGKE
ncbi:hypothetical protein EST92_17550 [Streptomyces sp. TM32]|uniref:hypothetical protein n=1 Tax=Streptomyces sp. TM32 TaxID=1652669 RepID=UPI001010A03F|nr:hypothetical protein [Streptomyces sp. TM32]RXS80450.1 hypothetical protein EST92_17550 [Streptomyces sp. TM32]